MDQIAEHRDRIQEAMDTLTQPTETDGLDDLLGELDECIPASSGIDSALEDQEIAASISAFLRGLSRENRVMFLRRYWYGDSLASIALRLGCGEGKVKSALFRTRKALRSHLEQEGIWI